VAVLVQVAIMVMVCMIVLVDQRGHLSGTPFLWAHLTGGLTGLSVGFPLALYMFIGWENGLALAEECRNPKRTVPRALYISVAIGGALFVFFAYATVTGFNYDVSSVGRSSVPFLTLADHYLGGAAVLAWVAGIVSILATLVASTNSQARMLFDGGRTGLLPTWLGRVRPRVDTPVNALLVMAAVGLGIIGVWWASHLIGGVTGSMNPVGLYAECSTMGTIVILFVSDDALSPPLHVAPPSGIVLASPSRGDPDPGVPHPHRPVRRVVQARAARAL
jgi:amino acid transporter